MNDITAPRGVAGERVSAAAPALAAETRLRDVDLLRGLVIVLMALDHTRDYFHAGAFSPLDPDRSYAALYATRWITHLCAPVFVFLAGVAAYLQRAKGKQAPQLSWFLFTRGLFLVALELTFVRFAWTFAIPYQLILQVIWALGLSMVVLAGLVWLPRAVVLLIGVAIVAGHNLLDPLTPAQFGTFAPLWMFLHDGGPLVLGGMHIGFFSYPVLPWVGVMALGYGLGTLFLEDTRKRDRTFLLLGGAMIAAFALLRGFNLYGDSFAWVARDDLMRSAMAFLNVRKYPPSLMYVLATLGIAFMLVPVLARQRGPLAHVLLVFGAVPLFFYVLHLYVAHGLAIAANVALEIAAPGRQQSGFSLAGVYVAWIVVLALLYPACRWWAKVKRTKRAWWLSYL